MPTTKESLAIRKQVHGQAQNRGQKKKYKEIEFKDEPRQYPFKAKKINFRQKFALENIEKIEKNRKNLTPFERVRFDIIKSLNFEDISQDQFNALQEIAERFK